MANKEHRKLLFCVHQNIGSQYKMTIPEEVRELLFDDPEDSDNIYLWHFDDIDNNIMVSNGELFDEERTGFEEKTDTYKSTRTTIPDEIRKKMDLIEGDELYFVTHKEVLDEKPVVFVWTFEKLEKLLLSGAEQADINYPRQPQF